MTAEFQVTQAVELETALAGFKIKAKVVNAVEGPMVTAYDVAVPNGVKLRSVNNVAADIARQIKVKSCRVTQVPESGVMRFEIARSDPDTITMRFAYSDEAKFESLALPITLGSSIDAKPITVDLADAPHMLLAGATGSGKSVLLNAIIMSIIGWQTPDKCRLLMIDPKMLELTPYSGIPNLLGPVVTSSADAIKKLRMAVDEMEDRYTELAQNSVRSITEYNKLPGVKKMFRIVVVIDEYADLMLTNRYDIEDAVLRLAQKARAAGIHLILATQRPSVDVVTGVIKANFPMRVCLRVASRVDSRVVLDRDGAESLLGRGDLLAVMPGMLELQRAHAPFVSSGEIKFAVDTLSGRR